MQLPSSRSLLPRPRKTPIHVVIVLIAGAAAMLQGCATPQPADTSATTAQPGSFNVHMHGELRAFGSVSGK